NELWTAAGHRGWIYSLAFSPDGKRLASSGNDGNVLLWEAATGKQLVSMSVPDQPAGMVAFSPSGKVLAFAGGDGVIHLRDGENGQELGKLDGHAGGAFSVAITEDGKYLASGGADQVVRLWDLVARKELRQFKGHRGRRVSSLSFTPDGKLLASTTSSPGDDHTARIWEVETGKELHELPAEYLGSVAFSRDGKTLAVAPGDATVHLYDAKTAHAL